MTLYDFMSQHKDIDELTVSIMADIENIFAGYVSEKWLLDFAESLM